MAVYNDKSFCGDREFATPPQAGCTVLAGSVPKIGDQYEVLVDGYSAPGRNRISRI